MFKIVDKNGSYIIKLQSYLYKELPQNEDMHLKNYSLITREDKTELPPAYDLMNTSIALKEPEQMVRPA